MAILFFWILTGCATYGEHHPQTTSLEQVERLAGVQQPVQYKVGYQEGCDSGLLSAGDSSYKFQKDSHRYSVDDLYKHGWDDGYKNCQQHQVRSRYYSPGYYFTREIILDSGISLDTDTTGILVDGRLDGLGFGSFQNSRGKIDGVFIGNGNRFPFAKLCLYFY